MAFVFKAITPQYANIDQIREKVLNALRAEGRLMVREYQKTTATWQEHSVTFGWKRTFLGSGEMAVEAGPVSGDVQIWNWLNAGTSVRHAMLAPDFQRKTHPGQFAATSGQTASWKKVSKRFNFPGIEPRKWNRILSDERRYPFVLAVMEAVRQGLAQWTRESNASGR
jgi:hypothetical protein